MSKAPEVGMGILGVLDDRADTGARSFTPERRKVACDYVYSEDSAAATLLAAAKRADYYGRSERTERGYNTTNPGKVAMAAINTVLRDILANSEALAKSVGIDVLPGDVRLDASGGTVTLRFNVRDANSTPLTWQGPGGENMLDMIPAALPAPSVDEPEAAPDLIDKPKKKKKNKLRPMSDEATPKPVKVKKDRLPRLPPRRA